MNPEEVRAAIEALNRRWYERTGRNRPVPTGERVKEPEAREPGEVGPEGNLANIVARFMVRGRSYRERKDLDG